MCAYIHMCSLIDLIFLFSESDVMQAVYRIWGKVICVQMGCHSPLKEASEAEDSTVNKSEESLPCFVSYVSVG